MTSCEDVLDLLPEVLPRLTPHAIAVHEHLRSCVECGEAAEELTRVLHALETEGLPTPALSEGFADGVVDALPAPGFVRRLRSVPLFGWGTLAGSVAALMVGAVGVRLYVDGIVLNLHRHEEAVECFVAAHAIRPGQRISRDDIVETQFPRQVLEAYRNSRITDLGMILEDAEVVAPVEMGQVLQTYHFARTATSTWRQHDVVVHGPGTTIYGIPSDQDLAAPVAPRAPRPPRDVPAVTAQAPTPAQPPSIQVAGGPARRAQTSAARSYAAAEARGADTTLVRYVTDAGLVLEAVAVLDEPDPHWLRVLARRVDDADLLERGERLLIELRRDPDQGELRPLISATQLVLRKVRHAPAEEAELAFVTLRREVSSTGLLEAYRTLLAPAPAAPSLTPPAAGGGPF